MALILIKQSSPAENSRDRSSIWCQPPRRISLEVGAGDIVGLGGFDGQGPKTILLALFAVLGGVMAAS